MMINDILQSIDNSAIDHKESLDTYEYMVDRFDKLRNRFSTENYPNENQLFVFLDDLQTYRPMMFTQEQRNHFFDMRLSLLCFVDSANLKYKTPKSWSFKTGYELWERYSRLKEDRENPHVIVRFGEVA